MTKEMKRPISNITQDSIKPFLSNAVEFYTNKYREAHKCIQERDEYINYLESKLSNAKPQLFYIVLPKVFGLSDSTFVSKVESGIISEFTNGKDYALKLTEQEIKSIDQRYWQFAVPVPVEDGE
ncbi:hypothetical protein C41431_22 [Lactococcus phage C41431]|nr:hypothetical protein C41431_22 [Lactococcus phage C41431]